MDKRDIIISEAVESLIKNNGGTVVLSTGTGKTKMVLDFILRDSRNTEGEVYNVVLVGSRVLLEEVWKQELKKWGFKNKYGFIYEHKDTPKPIKFEFKTSQLIYKYENPLPEKYNLLVVDEIHSVVTKEYSNIFNIVKYDKVIGLTGTPFGKDEEEKLELYNRYCPIIFTYTNSSKDGIINKRQYFIIEHVLDNDHKFLVQFKTGKFYKGELDLYTYYDSKSQEYKKKLIDLVEIERNTNPFYKIYDIKKELKEDIWEIAVTWGWKKQGTKEQNAIAYNYLRTVQARKNLLLLSNTRADVALQIKNKIREKDHEARIVLFSELNDQLEKITDNRIYSKNNRDTNTYNLKRFNSNEVKEIGGCNSLNTSVNLKNTKYGILESYVGSTINTRQRFGRLDRLSPDDIAYAFIIKTKNTQMEKWFRDAMKDIDLSRAEVININEL